MPRPSNLSTREYQWHQEVAAYAANQKRRARNERLAAIGCCLVIPALLGLVLHLNW